MQQEKEKGKEKEREFEMLNSNQRVEVLLWGSSSLFQSWEHIAFKLYLDNAEDESEEENDPFTYVSFWDKACGFNCSCNNYNGPHFHFSNDDKQIIGNPSQQFELYSLNANRMHASLHAFRNSNFPWSIFGTKINALFDETEFKNKEGFSLALLDRGGLFKTLGYQNFLGYYYSWKILLQRRLPVQLSYISLCSILIGSLGFFLGFVIIGGPISIATGPIGATVIFTTGATGAVICLTVTLITVCVFKGLRWVINVPALLDHPGNLCLSAAQREQDKFLHVEPIRINALIRKIRWEIKRLRELPFFSHWWGAADKANELENALARASTKLSKVISLARFLKKKINGQPSILDIAKRRRSSWTANPTTTYRAITGALSRETAKCCLIDRFAELGLNSDTIAKFTSLIFKYYKGGKSEARMTEVTDIENGDPDQECSSSY